MPSVELFVIENNNDPGMYLLRTDAGQPVFVQLSQAKTYFSRRACANAISRIRTDFDVEYHHVRLEVIE